MYINLFTLRNIAQKLDVSDAQNMKKKQLFLAILDKLQCWSEIIETNAKNGVVFDATSNEQPIKMTNPVGLKTSLLYL